MVENGELKPVPFYSSPKNYHIANQLPIGIKESVYLQGEIARQAMGFSPADYYGLPGTREHIKIGQKIPLCQCDVIAIYNITKEKANIIANEEYKKSKAESGKKK